MFTNTAPRGDRPQGAGPLYVLSLLVALGGIGCGSWMKSISIAGSARACEDQGSAAECRRTIESVKEYEAQCADSPRATFGGCAPPFPSDVASAKARAWRKLQALCQTEQAADAAELCVRVADALVTLNEERRKTLGDDGPEERQASAIYSAVCKGAGAQHPKACALAKKTKMSADGREQAAKAAGAAAMACSRSCVSECDKCGSYPAACESGLQQCLAACGPHVVVHCRGWNGD